MTVHVTAADVLRTLREHLPSSLGDYHAIYLSRGGPGADDDVVLTGTFLELAELVGALTGVVLRAVAAHAAAAVEKFTPTETPT